MKAVLLFLATTGLSALPRVPPAPGTWGTLVGGVPAYVALSHLSPTGAAVGGLVVIVVAVIVAGRAERVLGRHDPGIITVDEVAGFLVTMAGAPAEPRYIVAGLVLFRLFDIVKPFPADRIDQRVPGGVGTVLDDCVAGLYGFLALSGLRTIGF